MPSVLRPVPHFEQSRDGACLPACARMVLAYFGDERSETELCNLLETKSFGTPIGKSKKLEALSYTVLVRPLSKEKVEAHLNANQPVIARVWTEMLDYWDVTTSHVVVLVGFDDDTVFINDPAFAEAPKKVVWDSFLAAWAEYDETAVIISRG